MTHKNLLAVLLTLSIAVGASLSIIFADQQREPHSSDLHGSDVSSCWQREKCSIKKHCAEINECNVAAPWPDTIVPLRPRVRETDRAVRFVRQALHITAPIHAFTVLPTREGRVRGGLGQAPTDLRNGKPYERKESRAGLTRLFWVEGRRRHTGTLIEQADGIGTIQPMAHEVARDIDLTKSVIQTYGFQQDTAVLNRSDGFGPTYRWVSSGRYVREAPDSTYIWNLHAETMSARCSMSPMTRLPDAWLEKQLPVCQVRR